MHFTNCAFEKGFARYCCFCSVNTICWWSEQDNDHKDDAAVDDHYSDGGDDHGEVKNKGDAVDDGRSGDGDDHDDYGDNGHDGDGDGDGEFSL